MTATPTDEMASRFTPRLSSHSTGRQMRSWPMPIERVVINASPLITLFPSRLHPLLPQLSPELLVPDSVWNEVVKTYADPAARGLPAASWARRTPVTVELQVQLWGLGAGETAVLSSHATMIPASHSSPQRRQKAGLKSTSSVKISSRPSSMATQSIQIPVSCISE